MVENAPSSDERPTSRWPLILGGLVGGFLLLAAGLALGWYLFYRPIVNVAVQLPAPPPPPAPAGPDAAQVKALEDQIEKQKAANKQIEEQIALLKERLKEVLYTLTDREQEVLTLRFGLQDGYSRTLEEVGRRFTVTRERIRQIEAKALRKMRHPTRLRKLEGFLEVGT